jgi:xylulokinase
MRENGITPSVIRAGKANMFLSNVFLQAFVNVTNVPVELYDTDGSIGAAKGAGVGAKIFSSAKEAFLNMEDLQLIEPSVPAAYDEVYQGWKELLHEKMQTTTGVENIITEKRIAAVKMY